jgi:hypothetical protein
VECGKPPLILWSSGGLDHYRMSIGWTADFAAAKRVVGSPPSGEPAPWVVPEEIWRRACESADGSLYLRLQGENRAAKKLGTSPTVRVKVR